MLVPATAMTTVSLYSISDAHAKEAAVDLDKVRESIQQIIDTDAEKRGDGTSLAGTFIRLAWHASGTYKKADNSGGSNGAKMRFNPEASYGATRALIWPGRLLSLSRANFPS